MVPPSLPAREAAVERARRLSAPSARGILLFVPPGRSPLPRAATFLSSIARLEPVKPAINRGLRAAVAVLVPMLAARFLHAPAAAWATLGGFLTTVADKGGDYRTRAMTMGALPVFGALTVMAAGIAGNSPWLAIPFAFLGVLAGGLTHVYGAGAGSIGGLISIALVVSLAAPSSGVETLVRGAGMFLGGLWVMGLALFLWPIRPYRPVRLAVAACYRALADHAAALAEASRRAEEASRRAEEAGFSALIARHAPLRALLESARAVMVGARRGRQGESGRGERLLVLFQTAEQLFGTLVALADTLETASDPRFSATRVEAERALGAFAATAREAAWVVETEGHERPAALPVTWSDRALRAAIAREDRAAGDDAVMTRSQYLHAAALLARLREYAGVAVETAATLDDERPAPGVPGASSLESGTPQPIFGPLRDNLTTDSVVLRHALRVGVAAALATAISSGFHLTRGYWVTVTVIVILQPYTGVTFLKALQRIVGTVLGGILAAAIAAAVHDPRGILALVVVFAAVGVALLPINYGAFSTFLTPAFVLLAEVNAGDYRLVGVRIVNTLLGGAIALSCSVLLWPSPERERFPDLVATTLQKARELLVMADAWYADEREDAAAALDEARRSAGLAAGNAEASFQRLVSESRGPAEQIEPLMTMITYTRRFIAAVLALASSRRSAEPPTHLEDLSRFARRAQRVLLDLEGAVAQQRPPERLPELLPGDASNDASRDSSPAMSPSELAPVSVTRQALFHAQLERVARQLTILHGAIARLYPAAERARD